jgi:hypothetical protein
LEIWSKPTSRTRDTPPPCNAQTKYHQLAIEGRRRIAGV